MRRIVWFIMIIFVFSVIMWGCNISEEVGISDKSVNSAEDCEYRVNSLLDKKEYDEAINLLNGECKDLLNSTTRNINLAAAYLGKAGFTIFSIINDILNAKNSTQDTYSYDSFLSAISRRATGTALKNLNKAMDYYKKATGGVNCTDTSKIKDSLVKEACFMKGVVQVATAGTTFALLFKETANETSSLTDLIDYWVSGGGNNTTCDLRDINQNNVPDSADFSACAMNWAVNNGTLTINTCDSVELLNTCNFGYPGKEFKILRFYINPKKNCIGYANSTNATEVVENATGKYFSVLTDGYCYCNGTPCDRLDPASGCYPCPLILDEETNQTATQVGLIVEALNEGVDAITSVVGVEENATNATTDIESAVNDFKADFCEENPAQCACYFSNGTCTSCDKFPGGIDNATDIQLGECVNNSTTEVTYQTQQLIVDYILNATAQ